MVYLVRGLTAAAVPEFFDKTPVALHDLETVVAMKARDPNAVPDSVMPNVQSVVARLRAKSSPAPAAPGPPAGFPRVLDALRAAPGVLGVETGETAGGRRVIFAWFADKKALVDWYYSEAHQRAMKTLVPAGVPERKPLPDLADETENILAIVSVKFVETGIASIGIELYGPLPGGIAVGGRFAPDAVKVKGLREIKLPGRSS